MHSPVLNPVRFALWTLRDRAAQRRVVRQSPQFPPDLKVERLCSHGKVLHWGETVQGHIRAVVIVGPHPLRGEVLNFFNTGPVILG